MARYEMQRLTGRGRGLASALARDPRATTMPVQGGPGRPKFPPTQSSQPQPQPQPQPQQLTRLSPGVYRDASGALVNQQGGALPNQPQRGGMAQPYGNLENIYGQAGSIPGARQDMLQIPPNVPPMPKGGQNMQNMGQQLGRDAYIMNQIRTGNIPQMPGNNMISRGVNEATRNLYAQAQDKYAQQQPQFMNPQITMPPRGTNPESYTQPLQYDQFGRPDARSLVGFEPNRMTPEQIAAMTTGFQGENSGIVAQRNSGMDSRQYVPNEMQRMQAQSYNQQQLPQTNRPLMQPQIRRY